MQFYFTFSNNLENSFEYSNVHYIKFASFPNCLLLWPIKYGWLQIYCKIFNKPDNYMSGLLKEVFSWRRMLLQMVSPHPASSFSSSSSMCHLLSISHDKAHLPAIKNCAKINLHKLANWTQIVQSRTIFRQWTCVHD